ncbi:hypothetical protein NV379_06125 [Paenibacillus sp. N1-5-1-14]|uniref:WD40/YVTN/BNR-like repeat-containing protein n=1 Tax=Paenibacillus radicibacter TaxID=2972488 RepID=UPI0021591511|nr:hypothetical protein [Paenibacillus radicibacter]MCR8642233.1 hypothetical protein [Paenibacillus radicibacter]
MRYTWFNLKLLILISIVTLLTIGCGAKNITTSQSSPTPLPSPSPSIDMPSTGPDPSLNTIPTDKPSNNSIPSTTSPSITPKVPNPSATPPAKPTTTPNSIPSPFPSTSPIPPTNLRALNFLPGGIGWTADVQEKGTQIWRTTDNGAHWESSFISDAFVTSLSFADPSQGYAVANRDCSTIKGQVMCQQFEILHTADGGKSWTVQFTNTQAPTDPIDFNANKDTITFLNTKVGYAIANHNLYATIDGSRWKKVQFGNNPSFIPDKLNFINTDTGWVLGKQGSRCKATGPIEVNCQVAIEFTTDGGKSWSHQFNEAAPTDALLNNIGISFISKNEGWVLIQNLDRMESMLYRTTDGGTTWTHINTMRGARPTTAGLQFLTSKKGSIPLSIGAGPIEGGIKLTSDGGVNWTQITPEQSPSFEAIDFVSELDGWAIGTTYTSDGSHKVILHSIDGGLTWKIMFT